MFLFVLNKALLKEEGEGLKIWEKSLEIWKMWDKYRRGRDKGL